MLDVVGNNISNVNTTGYKSSSVVFEDMMSQTLSGASPDTGAQGGTNPRQIGLGVTIASINSSETQGALQTTGVTTDLAIQGDGYFILNNHGTPEYTRDGSFSLDENGVLVSASGMQVQGWTAANGVLNTTQPIGNLTVPIASRMNALATSTATMTGNLNSGSLVGDTYSNNFIVYDSLGATHTATITYTKTAADTWDWQASGAGIAAAGLVNQGQLTFDVNGQLLTQTGGLSITVGNGAATPLAVNPDFTQVTQLNSTATVTLNGQNGYAPGTLTSFNIADSGVINGVYDNGVTRILGQVALARFSNAGGLTKQGDNNLTESANSGLAQVGTAGTSARGTISAGSLEMSNVNLAQEFSNMIIAERAFQANSKVITTSDELLDTLVNMKR
jgi:flagellar hook protein FlgE